MTVGTDVATPGDAGSSTEVEAWGASGDVGLEDIGIGDISIPRLRIVHEDGVFEDNLSKARFSSLGVILLGLVKQRIMWDSQVDDGDKPQCKSPDFNLGFPQMRTDINKEKQFPWEKSNFNAVDYPAANGVNGLVTLPCEKCIFKEWDKGGWKQPPCAEQHTYPLLYSPDGESWTPALFTVQKTGIKPSRQYISSFAQSKTPMFTVVTTLSLTQQSRGSVKFSVPNFRREHATERAMWDEYATRYRGIREFIRSAPRPMEEETTTDTPATPAAPVNNENVAPAAPVAAQAAPAPATPAPAAPAPAAPAPAAPAAPAPAPSPAAPAAAAPAPVTPSPEAAPVATGNELPF